MNSENLATLIEKYDLNIKTNPKGTDKLWPHKYIEEFYETEFKVLQLKPIKILEIGFRHGASLFLWSNYFPNAQILGLDNQSDLAVNQSTPVDQGWIDAPRIKIQIGDAYSQATADEVANDFDVIIDDGPHSLPSQLKFLELYLPKLTPNGVAIIEDLQRYGGLTFWPLLFKTPLKYQVELYDFRNKSGLMDDLLYVVRNTQSNPLLSRVQVLLKAAKYLVTEPIRVALRKLKTRPLTPSQL
jgi:hypothetical protein